MSARLIAACNCLAESSGFETSIAFGAGHAKSLLAASTSPLKWLILMEPASSLASLAVSFCRVITRLALTWSLASASSALDSLCFFAWERATSSFMSVDGSTLKWSESSFC